MNEGSTKRRTFEELLECEETVFFYDKTACHQHIKKQGAKIIPEIIKGKLRVNTMGIQFITTQDQQGNIHAIVSTKDYQLAQRYFHMVYTFFEELKEAYYGVWPNV